MDFNPSNIPPDLLEKAKKWEAQSYPAQQLKALQDVRDELGKLSAFLSTSQTDDQKSDARVVETVQAMLKALNVLGDQQSFNADFAQPVVSALDKLQTSLAEAIKGIEVTTPAPVVNVKAPAMPEVKLGDMPAPVVNVEAPQVNLDLSGVQKVLKTDIPKAFNQAIAQIPETQPTDMSPVLEAISGLMPLLEEINIGVRLKPLSPSNMKVTNMDGTPVTGNGVMLGTVNLNSGNAGVPTNIFRDPFTFQNSANWTFNSAASDLLYEGGNVASASYVSIAKSALVADSYSEVISTQSWPLSVLVGAGLSLSQRIPGQHFAFDLVAVDSTLGNIIASPPVADIALSNVGAVVLTNVVTFTTATNHRLLPGDIVVIYGCTDNRMNSGEQVVTTTPSLTTFTVANTIANATYTVGTNAFVRFLPSDNYASYILAHYFTGVSSTNDSSVSKNGDRQPEISLWNPVSAASNAVVANENGLNYSGLAYTDAFRANYEYILRLNQKHAQFTLRNIDANAIPGSTQHRSHNFPSVTNNFKIRFRARNNPNHSIPVGYITAAVKSASTTATLTIPSHGLTTADWIEVFGIRDQANFANQTSVVQVASVPDANTITVVFGLSATASSYGGFVVRVQGQNAITGTTSSSIQTYAATTDLARLSLVFAATPANPLVGEVWTLYGLVDSTNTPQTALFGRYKVALFNATTFTLELIPLDGQVVSGISTTPINAGGGMLKNTEFRLHFARAENESPATAEIVGGDGNSDFANAIPVQPTNTPNISTVTTVSTVTSMTQMGGFILKDTLLNFTQEDSWSNAVRARIT